MTEKAKTYQYPPLVPRHVSMRNALRMVQNPIPLLMENVHRYGRTYTFHVGGMKKGIVTTEPEFIQHVLQKHHRNYRKSKLQSDILARYIGQGLLTSDGAYWLRQRRLIQPAFHREKLRRIVGIMAEEVDRYFEEARWGTTAIDIYHAMHTLAFRIVARALFSTDVDASTMTTLSQQITILQRFVTRRIRQPYLHWWFALSGALHRHDAVAQASRDLILRIIRARKATGAHHHDLLDLLLTSRYEDTGALMDEQQVLDESLILFVAGHETSANALTWCIYLLSQHPDWLGVLREECNSIEPTFDGLMKLTRTRQVIEETMRLYPPAWVIDRLSGEADEILGYSYPADTFLILFIYGTHHDSDLWPHPGRFDPSRFEARNTQDHIPFSYLPFGGGPRLCIGNQFAMLEMLLVISHLVRHYTPVLHGAHPQILPLVTLRPKGRLEMQMMS